MTTKTELLNNGIVVATKLAAPFYTWDWVPSGTGAAVLTYKRYEDDVLVYTSGAINGTVEAVVADTTAPTISSATVENANPSTLVVVFSEVVSITDVTGLTIAGAATPTLSAPTGSGTNTLSFTLSAPLTNGQTVTLEVAGTNNIIDAASNALVAVSQAITNNVAAATIEAETTAYMNNLGIVNDTTPYYSSTAFATTGAALWTAVDNFVKREKTGSRWSKLFYFRPAIGTTAAQQSKNLKDIANYDGVYNGDWVFDGNGRLGNGTNTYMPTGFQSADWVNGNDAGVTVVTYGGFGGYPIGGQSGLSMASMELGSATKWTSYMPYSKLYNDLTGNIGVKTMVRNALPEVRNYRNGVFKGAIAGTATFSAFQLAEGCQYDGTTPAAFFNGYIGSTAVHSSFTDAEAIAFQNSISELEFDLKRKNW